LLSEPLDFSAYKNVEEEEEKIPKEKPNEKQK